MNAIYTAKQKEKDTLYVKIIYNQEILNTPYEIYVLLTQLVQKTLKNNFDEDFYYHTKEYEKAREIADMLIKQYYFLLTEKQ
jgi:hypothetical protein